MRDAGEEPRKLVGVCSPGPRDGGRRLFGSLAAAFPVSFEPRAPGEWRGLDAAIVLGVLPAESQPPPELPCLVAPDAPAGAGREVAGSCRLASDPELPLALRGQTLSDEHAPLGPPIDAGPADAVLGAGRGGAIWARIGRSGGALYASAAACDDLAGGEVLRQALSPGRSLGLLPLVHFLRHVARDLAWTPPGPRALFVIDDPNLRWTSYGHLNLRRLAEHAEAHGYHAALGMIPLDSRFPNRAAVGTVAGSERLSMVAHGANHEGPELLHTRSPEEARGMLAQAQRRLDRFEARTGLAVERVMIPPHGVCSMESMAAMLELGYEGVCTFWPFPQPPGAVPAGWPLAGWEPAQLLAGGLPVLPRYPLTDHPLEDLVLRAFLDQPLVVFGHHWDLADDLDRVAEVAAFVGRLGPVRWESAASLARGNFSTRRDGELMRVRMFGRQAALEVPASCRALSIEVPRCHGEARRHHVVVNGSSSMLTTSAEGDARVAVEVEQGSVAVRLVPELRHDPDSVPRPPVRVRPVLRRLATEARDRSLPALSRLPGDGRRIP